MNTEIGMAIFLFTGTAFFITRFFYTGALYDGLYKFPILCITSVVISITTFVWGMDLLIQGLDRKRNK